MSVSVCSGEGSQQPGVGGGLAATSPVGSGRPALSSSTVSKPWIPPEPPQPRGCQGYGCDQAKACRVGLLPPPKSEWLSSHTIRDLPTI